MKNKPLINSVDILKSFKKALEKTEKEKTINITYLDKDGSIKKFKSKINRR